MVDYKLLSATTLKTIRVGLTSMVYISLYKNDKFLLQILTFSKVKLLAVHWEQPWWCTRLCHSHCHQIHRRIQITWGHQVTYASGFGTHFRVKPNGFVVDLLSSWYDKEQVSLGELLKTNLHIDSFSPCLFFTIFEACCDLLGVYVFSERKKPEILHKFVFRMNFTVESSSIAEYASQRGNKTFFSINCFPQGRKEMSFMSICLWQRKYLWTLSILFSVSAHCYQKKKT